MKNAIQQGKIQDEMEWEPVSRLIKNRSVTMVQTEREISNLDPVLLEMVREHEFFLDDFTEDLEIAVGGGLYDVPVD